MIHICWLASGPGGQRFQWNSLAIQFPDYTIFITYFQHMTILSTFTHHIYLRVGDIERAWLTKSVVPNTLIQFDSNTFPADRACGHQDNLSHWGYLSRFRFILLHVNVCPHLSMVSLYIYIFKLAGLLYNPATSFWL